MFLMKVGRKIIFISSSSLGNTIQTYILIATLCVLIGTLVLHEQKKYITEVSFS